LSNAIKRIIGLRLSASGRQVERLG